MQSLNRLPLTPNAFSLAILPLQWLLIFCQDEDYGNISDDIMKDLMKKKMEEDIKAAENGPKNVTIIEKRASDIEKGRGELTGDLLRHHLISDFVYDCPFIVCTVEWVEGNFADLGNIVPTNVTKRPPHWLDWRGNKTEFYTFIMSGLDEPSRKSPSLREYQHWVLVNVPGNKFKEGETLASYVGPEPGIDTGLHRVGIVVYKQPHKIQFKEKPILSRQDDHRRVNFSNIDFANKYEMGEPVAINFFQTESETTPTTRSPTTRRPRRHYDKEFTTEPSPRHHDKEFTTEPSS